MLVVDEHARERARAVRDEEVSRDRVVAVPVADERARIAWLGVALHRLKLRRRGHLEAEERHQLAAEVLDPHVLPSAGRPPAVPQVVGGPGSGDHRVRVLAALVREP